MGSFADMLKDPSEKVLIIADVALVGCLYEMSGWAFHILLSRLFTSR